MCNMYFARKSYWAEVTKCCQDVCKSVPFFEITSYYSHLKIKRYMYLPSSLPFSGDDGDCRDTG